MVQVHGGCCLHWSSILEHTKRLIHQVHVVEAQSTSLTSIRRRIDQVVVLWPTHSFRALHLSHLVPALELGGAVLAILAYLTVGIVGLSHFLRFAVMRAELGASPFHPLNFHWFQLIKWRVLVVFRVLPRHVRL